MILDICSIFCMITTWKQGESNQIILFPLEKYKE